jgi:hypothetical protein
MAGKALNSRNAKPGKSITGRLMQDIVLASGERIRAGAKVVGQVVESSPNSSTGQARLLVRFDRLIAGGKQYSITTSLRSLASMQDVFNAQLPTGTFDEYGTSISDWTTVQVGGAAVYLGDATVRDGMNVIGQAPGYGITRAKLIAAPKRGCVAKLGESTDEQSLWVFSPWACGTYGFEDLAISHHGTTQPIGVIELTAPKAFRIQAGSGWLLLVMPSQASAGNSGVTDSRPSESTRELCDPSQRIVSNVRPHKTVANVEFHRYHSRRNSGRANRCGF